MSENLRFSKAWKQAGFREKYAMENGQMNVFKDDRGHIMWRFKYDKSHEFQDANGALYDETEERWVN